MITEQGVIHCDGPDLAWCRWTSAQADSTSPGRPTIVLAHGLADSASCWTRVAERLTAELPVDVIAVDARGHGRSERATDYSFAAGVGDLVAACAGLGLRRPVPVGHSMGGPHVVAAAPLVQATAVAVIDPHWPLHPQGYTADEVASWRDGIAREAVTDFCDLVRKGRLDHPGWHDEDLAAWAAATREVDPAVTAWIDDHELINAWREAVARLRCPLLVVTGDREVDPHVTVDDDVLAEVRALQPGVQHHRVMGAGHSVHRDDVQSVAGALIGFLRRRGSPEGFAVRSTSP